MNKRFIILLLLVTGMTHVVFAQSPESDVTVIRNADIDRPGAAQRGVIFNRQLMPMGRSRAPAGMMFFSNAAPLKLFPPELIMHNQDKLNLTSRQVTSIKDEMKAYQSSMVDIQWALSEAQTKLDNELSKERIDEDAALALVDSVMEAESDMKKSHMALLIRVRNILDAAQLEELQNLGHSPMGGMAMPMAPHAIMP